MNHDNSSNTNRSKSLVLFYFFLGFVVVVVVAAAYISYQAWLSRFRPRPREGLKPVETHTATSPYRCHSVHAWSFLLFFLPFWSFQKGCVVYFFLSRVWFQLLVLKMLKHIFFPVFLCLLPFQWFLTYVL